MFAGSGMTLSSSMGSEVLTSTFITDMIVVTTYNVLSQMLSASLSVYLYTCPAPFVTALSLYHILFSQSERRKRARDQGTPADSSKRAKSNIDKVRSHLS